MKTLKEEYENWKEMTQPKDATQIQTIEARRAFYAGSYILFNMLQEIAVKHREEDAEKLLEKIDKEIICFFVDVKNGRA